MKKFWKILGLGALIAGLTPYKVEKNEETGENSYQALLWRITSAPGDEETKREIGINLGEGTLTSKLRNAAGKTEEPHLFSDELCVEYTGGTDATVESAEKAAETVEKAVEETVETVKDAVEETVETVKDTAEETAEAVEEAAEESVEAAEEAAAPEEPAEEAAEEPKAE
ncbi:MAG: hypothetical protein HDT18_10760 [Oscillibacter sp.]|nr:hypothetical protein [Oscillibacter sp.]